jgi:AhpD family alkylhydroperoxidase
MTQRLDYPAIAPAGMAGFRNVSGYIAHSALERSLVDIVYLRVSQINGCAYCIDKHSRDLIAGGMSLDKLVLIPAWREAGQLFSDREQAALAWAETVTRVAETAVPEADFKAAHAQFGDSALVDLTIAISLMNAYNRLAISFRTTPKAAQH